MQECYLDNSASTPLCDKARGDVLRVMDSIYGNPSSLHHMGQISEKEIIYSRNIILSTFSLPGQQLQKNNLIFTSGGTEANNLAIAGVINSKPRYKGKKIITTSSEHDSVLNTVKYLEKSGYNCAYIDSPNGKLDEDKLLSEIDENTILVSMMLVNNETGSINNINDLTKKIKQINPNVIIHCDAVQGYMKLPYSYYSDADLVSISGHKINALKGIGALFVKPNINKLRAISPIIFGGGQESGIRSGTENLLGIVSFGSAVQYYKDNSYTFSNLFQDLYSYLSSKLSNYDESIIRVNYPNSTIHANHIVNMTVKGIKSETLLHFLSSKNVYVSSGSACASNTNSKSHVLKSFGLSDNDIDSSIRISLGVQNTKNDIDYFITCLDEAINTLQRKK